MTYHESTLYRSNTALCKQCLFCTAGEAKGQDYTISQKPTTKPQVGPLHFWLPRLYS